MGRLNTLRERRIIFIYEVTNGINLISLRLVEMLHTSSTRFQFTFYVRRPGTTPAVENFVHEIHVEINIAPVFIGVFFARAEFHILFSNLSSNNKTRPDRRFGGGADTYMYDSCPKETFTIYECVYDPHIAFGARRHQIKLTGCTPFLSKGCENM